LEVFVVGGSGECVEFWEFGGDAGEVVHGLAEDMFFLGGGEGVAVGVVEVLHSGFLQAGIEPEGEAAEEDEEGAEEWGWDEAGDEEEGVGE